MSDIPKQYEPADAQRKWYGFWESRGYFNADPNSEKQPHTIMIPLPNVTGALHMGHALNGTCQDLITRWRRMQGYEALWMPGTDHAGIATQAVVERRMLEEEGLNRHDIGREALVNRIWKWKDAYEERILGQLKSLGASCDWRRTRFTLDEVCSRAVRRTFFKLFKDGLIYRGKRLVNWDTYLQTAVADDEVFDEEIDGHFWTFNYPVVDEAGEPTGQRISFSTTRPETMLGDTAVCVHPKDERYAALIGKHVRIPLNGRVIPIIADPLLADPEMGTGAVKVTPAHDPNDYACYQRNPDIGIINILNPDGTLNENGGEWAGQDRYAARDAVLARMDALGHYEGVEDRKIPIKHSDRSKTPVEPYLSDQWFVKMDELADGRPGLAQIAMDAVQDGRVRFYPSRYAKTYLDWLGEKRDWCISRQLWWGHRIPVWSRVESQELRVKSRESNDSFSGEPEATAVRGAECFAPPDEWSACVIVRTVDGPGADERTTLVCVDDGHPDVEQQLQAAGFEQDPDVLDTWFSSALWPHATLGWPDTEHNPPLDEAECAKQVDAAGRNAVASGSPLNESPHDSPNTKTPNHQTPNTNHVLDYFYPGDVLVTSRDIITLWVARMVLTGLYNMDDVPFRHVCVHPKILDGFGQTMSKSKGNGVDPMDLIDKYGTDAVRFTIASFAGETQDVRLPVGYECPHCGTVTPQTLEHQKAVPAGGEKPRIKCPNNKCKQESQFSSAWFEPDPGEPVARIVSERFEYGRNFCNKFWNAARFALLNLEGYEPAPVTEDQLQLEDRWILSRLSTVAQQMDEYLGRYQFDAATRAVREFTWNEFCDWYLEMIKPRLRGEGRAESGEPASGGRQPAGTSERSVAQRVLVAVLDSLIRLLQPFTPFICEELWQRLGELAPERALPPADSEISNLKSEILTPRPAEAAAIIAAWPTIPTSWQDAALEQRFQRLQDTIVAVRNVRAVYNIPPGTQLQLHVRAAPEVAGDLQNVSSQFDNLAKTVLAAAGADVVRPPASAGFSLGDADGYVPLEGIIDREAELERQQKEAEKIRKHIAGHEKKLSNENFVNKAPEDVVNNVRETLANLKKQLTGVEEIIRDLSGG